MDTQNKDYARLAALWVFSLPRVQKQNLLDEKLLTGMDNWFWKPTIAHLEHDHNATSGALSDPVLFESVLAGQICVHVNI